MAACPNCKRHVFTGRDMLYASLDGALKCRVCGKLARLDLLSRWALAVMLAIILPMVLLYGDVFYSGHLFLVSLAVILVAWRLLSAIGFPILSLELAPRDTCFDQRQSLIAVGIIVAAAVVIDGYMAYRIDADEARGKAQSVSATAKPQ